MSKCTAFEADILDHYFLNSAIANVGDATGLPAAGTAGSLYVDLLGTWPGETGTVSGNQVVYTNYTHIAVPRSGSGWERTVSTMKNIALITFPTCGATPDTAVGWGVKRATGSTVWDYIGVLAQAASIPFVVENGKSANAVIAPSHGLSVSDTVRFIEVVGGPGLPASLSDGELDTVASSADGDNFALTTNSTLADGSGRFAEVLDKTITNGDVPKINADQIQITED
jgi:hypothetical protein